MAEAPREQVPREQAQRPGHDQSEAAAQERDDRFLAVYGGVLFAAAGLALVALLVAGAAFPPPVAMLVFAGLLALSVNRAVVFPSEYAATADLAILLAAVVACRGQGAFLGPLVLGMLAGLFDHLHWETRAFSRVAWNAGNRGVAAIAAAGVFAGVGEAFGPSTAALGAAAVLAALVATAVDGGLSVGMALGRGSALRSAWHELLDVDALVLPLTLIGAAIGFLAGAVGWWAVVPPALLLVAVPEVLQARSRVSVLVVRNLMLAVEIAIVGVVAAQLGSVPGTSIVCALVAGALLVGVELVVDDRAAVPAVVGVVVVAAVLAVGDDTVFTGALVAATATATAWWCTRSGGRRDAVVAVALAAIAGGGAGGIVGKLSGPAADLVGGVAAVVGFVAGALLVTRRADRARAAMWLVWGAPLVLLVPAVGATNATLGSVTVAPVVALVAGATALVWCGAPPWRSRVLSVGLGRVTRGGRRATFLALAVVAATASVVAAVVHGDAARAATLGATVAGGVAVAMAAGAVHQWRLAPRARARGAVVVVLAAALVGSYAVAGESHWWSPLPLLLALTATVVMARGPVARSDASANLARRARRAPEPSGSW